MNGYTNAAQRPVAPRPSPFAWGLIAIATSLVGIAMRERCTGELWGASVKVFANGCYSDISALYSARGLSAGIIPYAETFNGMYFEYPVVTGAFVRMVQLLVAGNVDVTQATLAFMHLTSVLLALLAGVVAYLIARLVQPRQWPAGMFALSPLLLLELTINWDLLAVALTVLALFLWSRDRSIAAAVVAALGVAAKLWPAFILAAMVLDAVRLGERRKAASIAFAGVTTWVVINAPTALMHWDGWVAFYRFSATRGNDWGSLWTAFMYGFNWQAPPAVENAVGIGGMAVGALVVAWLAWRYSAPVTLVALSLLTVFVTIGKVFSPQYSLWLLPLVALLIRDWRVQVAWQMVQVTYFVAIMARLLHVTSEGTQGLAAQPYSWLVLLLHIGNVATVVWAWFEHTRTTRLRTAQP